MCRILILADIRPTGYKLSCCGSIWYFPSKSIWFPLDLKLVPYIFLSKNNFLSPKGQLIFSQPQKCWKIVFMQQKVKTIIQLCLITTKASELNSVFLHFSAKKKSKQIVKLIPTFSGLEAPTNLVP